MELDGYRLQPVKIKRLAPTQLEMTLFEGRNRQIRRMCEAVDLKVTRLCRVAIGKIKLEPLPLGKWRHLTKEEVAYLFPQKENNHQGSEN
jgi:pseudouridine synthase